MKTLWEKLTTRFSKQGTGKWKVVKPKKLIVSETTSSTWNYHLREIVSGEEKYSGGAGPAICGKPLGWDTQTPVYYFVPGRKSHIPETFCQKCYDIAVSKGYNLTELDQNED